MDRAESFVDLETRLFAADAATTDALAEAYAKEPYFSVAPRPMAFVPRPPVWSPGSGALESRFLRCPVPEDRLAA